MTKLFITKLVLYHGGATRVSNFLHRRSSVPCYSKDMCMSRCPRGPGYINSPGPHLQSVHLTVPVHDRLVCPHSLQCRGRLTRPLRLLKCRRLTPTYISTNQSHVCSRKLSNGHMWAAPTALSRPCHVEWIIHHPNKIGDIHLSLFY